MQRQIKYHYLLAFSVVIGGFLRFYHIGQQPLWLDEAYSYWFSTLTMSELWTIVPKFEANPPFYYTILKMWTELFGSDEGGLRSLSAVMSIGCIPLVFVLGRLVGTSADGDKIGATAALMFAVFPVHVQYAQEARTYAMLTFATTLTLCSLLWIIRRPAEACRPIIRNLFIINQNSLNSSRRTNYFPWITAIIAIAVTLWSHNTAILYIFSLSIVLLAWFFLHLKANKIFFANMLVIVFAIFLLWGPYLIFLIPQTAGTTFPIPKPTVISVVKTVVEVLLGSSISWTISAETIFKIVAFVSLVIIAASGLLHIQRRSGPYVSFLIFSSILGPILLELAISLMFKPIFLARTLIYVSVPFFIAIAAGIMMLPSLRIRGLVLTIILLLFLNWSYAYHVGDEKTWREPWERIVHSIVPEARGDVVLFVPNNLELPFSYYAERNKNRNYQINPLPFPTNGFLNPPPRLKRFGSDSFKAIQMRDDDIPIIKDAIDQKSPVWLITRQENLFDQHRIVFNDLIRDRGLIATKQFGEISVFKFN